MKKLLYLHGFASNDRAYKAKFLQEKLESYSGTKLFVPNFNRDLSDFKYKTISGMIGRLRQYILTNKIEKPYLIASSLSGIVALHYNHRYQDIEGLLLLAPMTRFLRLFSNEQEKLWKETGSIKVDTAFAKEAELCYGFVEDGLNYTQWVKPPINTIIIHGNNDETVGFSESKDYALEYRVDLLELNAGHSLSDKNSLDEIWRQSKLLLKLD